MSQIHKVVNFKDEKIIIIESNDRPQYFILCSDGLLSYVDMAEANDCCNNRIKTIEKWDFRGIKS